MVKFIKEMNQDVVEELERIRERYDEEGDANRERAYRRAIESVMEYPERLKSGKQAMKLKWIGKSIGWRIDKVLGTDTVGPKDEPETPEQPQRPRASDSSSTNTTNTTNTTNEQSKRPKKRTTARKPSVDTPTPRMRAKFVDASPQRSRSRRPSSRQPRASSSLSSLPRETASRLLEAVRNIAMQVSKHSHVVLADSYRRGHQQVSRLVFLITERTLPKSTRRGQEVLRSLIATLRQSGLLKDASYISQQRTNVKGKAHFRSGHQLPIWFICIPACEWPFALLRYTGPHDIWTQLQTAASNKGWRLTEKTLLNGYITVRAMTERDVFRQLNLVYLAPTDRE